MALSLLLAAVLTVHAGFNDEAQFAAEQIFPPVQPQTHAPSIVECPNGDLLASWYGGSEGPESDAAVFGARRAKGERTWSKPFLMADRKGFPDCNTCMSIDARQRLWLFWPTIVANTWESSLMNYRISSNYLGIGSPEWSSEGIILLKTRDFRDDALKLLGNQKIRPPRGAKGGPDAQKAKLDDSMYQRMGWAPRCKPTVLPSGRILLPLYTDTFSISIMAISDDGGAHWFPSEPLIGFGNIQPTVLRKNDGTLVAYMRENGPRGCIRVAQSSDDGANWSAVEDTALPNPGAGIDATRLANGHWLLVYNDSKSSRATLAVSISEDEGKSWKWTRHLERHAEGRYHYPAVIQAANGTVHAIYSCFIAPAAGEPRNKTLKGIKHAAFSEAWVRAGD